MLSFSTKNKDIEHLLDRLTKYPVAKVDPKVAQALSRHKKIRYLSQLDSIYIRKGVVSLPPKITVERNGNKFVFKF